MGSAALTSSSFSQPIYSKNYDVFISFRGEDTRKNFTSHLHTSLTQNSLRTFIDYQLPKVDDISESLIEAIKGSSISVVVFSENYASSKWCLDELTQILQCRKDQGQFVILVFYNVDPSDVRKQEGAYEEAFAKQESDLGHNHDKLKKWKDALFETANLAGWHSQSFRRRLSSREVFIVLDDVDSLKQLDYLARECDCLGQGSKVVITTRDKHMANAKTSTGMEILHPSIESLTKLRSLHLNGLKLKNGPLKELCCLRSLEHLGIYRHAFDKRELHMLFDALHAIQKLSFQNCSNLIELPDKIKNLSRLQRLHLRSCKNLLRLLEISLSVK